MVAHMTANPLRQRQIDTMSLVEKTRQQQAIKTLETIQLRSLERKQHRRKSLKQDQVVDPITTATMSGIDPTTSIDPITTATMSGIDPTSSIDPITTSSIDPITTAIAQADEIKMEENKTHRSPSIDDFETSIEMTDLPRKKKSAPCPPTSPPPSTARIRRSIRDKTK